MRRFCIKSRIGRIEYLDLISETDDGYQVRLTKISDGSEKTNEVFLSRHLFELCYKTGYIFELGKSATVA